MRQNVVLGLASTILRRRAALVAVLVLAFLTLGLPRWLVDSHAPDATPAAASFATLCRDHGGTARTAPAATARGSEPLCTVRYGGRLYRMDAVTPRGWDADTAYYERVGCRHAQRQQAAAARRRPTPVFVFHRDTGVCEHRG